MARLTKRELSENERGVSDVLSIAFMFLIVVFAGVLLHSYRIDTINSAVNRQLQLKTEYLYRTLELSQVENYSLSYLSAIAENVMEIAPQVVPGDYLISRVDNVLSYFSSPGYAIMVKVTYENSSWEQVHPSEAWTLAENLEKFAEIEKFTFSGKITIIIAEAVENSRIRQADASLTLFKLR